MGPVCTPRRTAAPIRNRILLRFSSTRPVSGRVHSCRVLYSIVFNKLQFTGCVYVNFESTCITVITNRTEYTIRSDRNPSSYCGSRDGHEHDTRQPRASNKQGATNSCATQNRASVRHRESSAGQGESMMVWGVVPDMCSRVDAGWASREKRGAAMRRRRGRRLACACSRAAGRKEYVGAARQSNSSKGGSSQVVPLFIVYVLLIV